MQNHHKTKPGLISLFPMMLLTSCANQPAIRTEAVTVKVPSYTAMPAALTAPVPMPFFPQTLTNGSLADYVLALQAALHQANGQLSKIQSLQPKN